MDKISITRFNKVNGFGTLLAFFDILYDKLQIKEFKLIQGQKGLFVSNPSKKGKDNQYHDTVFFMDEQERRELERMVIEFYNKENNNGEKQI